jgi:DNA-binding MarR family transcriptional regulator
MMDVSTIAPARAAGYFRGVGRREPEEVLDALSAMTRSLRAAAAQTYAAFEVGSTQAKFLRHLGRNRDASQAELARATASDAALTGRVLETLIARGWVRRHRSDDDRRQYRLALSASGERARARVEAARRQVAKRMVSALTDADLADFERIARKIREAFEKPAPA